MIKLQKYSEFTTRRVIYDYLLSIYSQYMKVAYAQVLCTYLFTNSAHFLASVMETNSCSTNRNHWGQSFTTQTLKQGQTEITASLDVFEPGSRGTNGMDIE